MWPRPQPPQHPPLVVVAGHSGAGKTSLVEALVPALAARGVRVGAIKHDPKGHALYDHEGKDSWRFRRAGAAAVALAGPASVATFRDVPEEPPLDAVVALLRRQAELDLVLAEGYSDVRGVPKIEVFRPALGRAPRCAPHELLAVVTDDSAAARTALPGTPVLPLSHPDAVAQFLIASVTVGARPAGAPPAGTR